MSRTRLCIGLATVGLAVVSAYGGNLDSPGTPTDPASAMYTLEDIYNRLDIGAAGTQSVFAEPSAGPGGTGYTLNQVMSKAPATNANAAVVGDILSGKVYWGLLSGAWGQQTGSMPNRGAGTVTPGTTQQAIQQGYHSGSGYVDGDADLVTGNIKAGVNIFGVAGKTEVVDTTSGDAATSDILAGKKAWVDGAEVTGTAMPAPVAKTGAGDLPSYTEVAGEDGHASMRKGVAWPSPRFTDKSNGTVTDNLTGLIWLKNANFKGSTRSWANALADCAALANGAGGLTDGSAAGDWRLPNVRELQSLMDYKNISPALPSGHPFTGVQLDYYWSATTGADDTAKAWVVNLGGGSVNGVSKTDFRPVWPVRGGQ